MGDSPLRIVTNKPQDDPVSDGLENAQNEATHNERGQDELAELRRLLIEPEQTQIGNILERLNNPRTRAREMSRSLPEAIRLRANQDDAVTESLAPSIVTAFHSSIRKNPHPIAEAISPLMGPAIRRAISSALSQLIQSLDQTLKHSFSWQGLKWRLEALRTGKSFAEVVLYHTLVYRVEQVFLIHKQTGILLQHVAANSVSTKDADIVSGMLTAIQEAIKSFARDSFGTDTENRVDKLDMGDLEVWFEQGQHAVIAVVIQGNAPETLRSDFFAPAVEAVHLEMRESLEFFDGDTTPFEMTRHHLEDCLQSRYESQTDVKKFKVPAYLWVILGVVLAGSIIWVYQTWREQSRWNNYIAKLKSTPGIVVIETGTLNGKHFVTGLRDPLSDHPEKILKEMGQPNPGSVIGQWQDYHALHPDFILRRAEKILQPPAGVHLNFKDASLIATGTASHQWIADTKKMAPAIPGVDKFSDKDLIDEDMKEPELLRRRIEQRVIRFVMGTTQFVPGQNQELKDMVSDLQRLAALAPAASSAPQIEILGHADSEGDENLNLTLSQARATRMLSWLAVRGIDKDILSAKGLGTKEPVRAEINEIDRQFNRSVSFRAALLETAKQPAKGDRR